MVWQTKKQGDYKKKNRREARKNKENLDFTIFSQKISTHLLTVLIISVILHVEQRKGIKRERSIEIPGKVPKEVFNSSVYK